MSEVRPYPGQHVTLSPEVQRDSGYHFYQGALRYRDAAIRCGAEFQDVRTAFDRSAEWAIQHDPVCNLYCHAIELALKAYLIASGLPEKRLARSPYGHDLARLCDEAVGHGLILEDDYIASIAHLAESFGKQPYSFRYPQIDKQTMNFFHLMTELIDAVMQASFPTIIRKARSMGVPAPDLKSDSIAK